MDAGPTPTLIGGPDPCAGKTLAGEFRLVRLLGRGGMGAVYLGEQLSLQRRVAIKLLPPFATADPEALARFQREAVSAAKLQHPCIVQVYYFGKQEGQYFIAMEYVEGETLSAFLAKKGRLPVGEALAITREVAKALGAAHEQGVVHRDVKPENVFLSKDGRVKLGDFGLARDSKGQGGLSATGQVMGTPYYMPPEQCRGATVDARSDLYALGATLYHLLNGRTPYVGASAIDIIHQQVASPVPPSESFGPGLSPAVVDLVRRMMAKDPAERPASAKEVVAAIEKLAVRPSAQGPSKPPSRTAIPSVPGAAPASKPPSRPAIPAATSATVMPKPPAYSTVTSVGAATPIPPATARRRPRWILVAGIAAVVLVIAIGWKATRGRGQDGPPGPSQAPPSTTAPENPVPQPAPPQDPPHKVPLAISRLLEKQEGEPMIFSMAREAAARERWGEIVKIIDRAPNVLQMSRHAERVTKLRAEAMKALLQAIEGPLESAKKAAASGDKASAEKFLSALEALDIDEVDARVKEVRDGFPK
ncbi:MAG: protein kinase [Planctomycetota bacterium]